VSLDDAYANAAYIPDADGFLTYWDETARSYRDAEHTLGRAQLNQPYGAHPDQAFDLFFPAGRPLGLMIFVHGGYWLRFGRRDFSHLAQGACARDWAVALPSYPLAPGASIPEITQSVALAIGQIANRIPGPIVLAGHSAGGHLVARMGQVDSGLSSGVRARIRSIVPISPVADLRPLLQTQMSGPLGLTEDIAKAESPALHPAPETTRAHIWVGADERPAFLEQARLLAENWQSDLTIEPKKHHFDIIAGLEDPESDLLDALLGRAP
jgi:arylformamidase